MSNGASTLNNAHHDRPRSFREDPTWDPIAESRPGQAQMLGSLLAVVAVVVLTFPLDTWVREWFQTHAYDGTWLRRILKLCKYPFMWPTYLMVVVLLLHHRRWLHIGAAFGWAVLGGTAALHLLKFVFGRARPFVEGHGDYAFTWFGNPAANLDAFPSGHTFGAWILAILIGRYFPWSRWILYPLALGCSLSRIAQDMHYLSDIAAGIGLAVLVVLGFRLWFANEAFPKLRRADLYFPAPWSNYLLRRDRAPKPNQSEA